MAVYLNEEEQNVLTSTKVGDEDVRKKEANLRIEIKY